jgi:hypothetical protein
MSTVDELFAYAAIACVLQNKKELKRNLWTKQWLEQKIFVVPHFRDIELFATHSRLFSHQYSLPFLSETAT